jgi:hypothetical protein
MQSYTTLFPLFPLFLPFLNRAYTRAHMCAPDPVLVGTVGTVGTLQCGTRSFCSYFAV